MDQSELRTNISKLRKIVLESNNPDLQSLESELLQSWANKLNKNAVDKHKIKKMQDMEYEQMYGSLWQTFDNLQVEEQLLELSVARQQAQTLALTHLEQAASYRVKEAEERCANVLVDAALYSVEQTDKEVKERAQEERRCAAAAQAHQLGLQQRHRHTEAEVARLMDRRHDRAAAAVATSDELRAQLQQLEGALSVLQRDYRTAVMSAPLQRMQALEEEVRELRVAVDEAECEEQVKRQREQQQQQRQLEQQQLMRHLQQQIKDKTAAAERERRDEEEYLSIVSAVQQLECSLEQLTAAARRRRQLQQRDEVDRLLQARRLQQRSEVLHQQEEDAVLQQYDVLRRSLSIAEEQQVFLQYAPHLLPHLTPSLLSRLQALSAGD